MNASINKRARTYINIILMTNDVHKGNKCASLNYPAT